MGKPPHGRDILPAAGLLSLRNQEYHWPRGKCRGWEIPSARGACGGQRNQTARHHHQAVRCAPGPYGAQSLRSVGGRSTTRLHDVSGVVAEPFDGSGDRQDQAGAYGFGEVRARMCGCGESWAMLVRPSRHVLAADTQLEPGKYLVGISGCFNLNPAVGGLHVRAESAEQ